MRKGKVFQALVALTLIATLLCGSAMAASMGAKALSSTMPVYSSPSRVIGTLKQGTSFTVTAISGSWARIKYGKRTGYAKLSDIVFNSRIKAVSTKKSSISFMTKDSLKKNIYYTGTLRAGVPLYIAGINGNKLLFFDTSGKVMGYVPRSAVRKVR